MAADAVAKTSLEVSFRGVNECLRHLTGRFEANQPDKEDMPHTGQRILIIDDQMDSVALLLSYLQGQRVDILIALDGGDGLHKAEQGMPDLILLDVTMPGMDGFAVCRALKAKPRTAAIPVIFLSANDTVAHKLEGFAAGGVDYIGKPFSAAEVLARVYVHLQQQQRVARLQAMVARDAVRDNGSEREDDLVADAIAQLRGYLGEWPGMEELVRQVGSNEKKLTELFRLRFGMTVYEYLVELRLETARQQLENTRLQVQLISDRAGYRNASDFSRAFRRRYGIGPRQYRQASTTAADQVTPP